jgi:hypothetical protein
MELNNDMVLASRVHITTMLLLSSSMVYLNYYYTYKHNERTSQLPAVVLLPSSNIDSKCGTSLPPSQIALIFLMDSSFDTAGIWQRYLENAPADQWSMYIHTPANKSTAFIPQFFKRFLLPEADRKPTTHCTDLVSGTTALLRAAIADPLNIKFVLLSPTHAPVKPFGVMRARLLEDNATWLCVTPTAQWLDNGNLPKHHQWFALNVEDAKRKAAVDEIPAVSRCPDEYYISSPPTSLSPSLPGMSWQRSWSGVNSGVLHTVNTHVETGRCTTYVYWDDYPRDSIFNTHSGFWHDTVSIDRFLNPLSYCFLRSLVQDVPFLFARKITDTTHISFACLSTSLPAMSALDVLDGLLKLPTI